MNSEKAEGPQSTGGDIVAKLLGKGAVEAFVMRILGMVLLFAMHTILAQQVGASGYGIFSYTLTLTAMLAMFTGLGWPTAIMRLVAQYVEQQNWDLLRGVIVRSHEMTLLVSVVVSIVLWLVASEGNVDADLAVSIRYASILLPIMALVLLRRRVLLGLRKIKASIIPDELIIPLFVVVVLCLLNASGAEEALRIYLCVTAVVASATALYMWHCLPQPVRNIKSTYDTRTWLALSFPLLLASTSQLIMNHTDLMLLGVMVDMEDVGLYSAAHKIATLNTFIMTAINTVGAPMLAAAFFGGRYEEIRKIMRLSMLWSTLGALPLFLVMVFVPKLLLGFFGEQFEAGDPLLRILALGQLLNAMTGLAGSALTMTGREGVFAKLMGTMAIANAVADLIVIPIWGATGAAVVTTTSVAVMNSVLLVIVMRDMKGRYRLA